MHHKSKKHEHFSLNTNFPNHSQLPLFLFTHFISKTNHSQIKQKLTPTRQKKLKLISVSQVIPWRHTHLSKMKSTTSNLSQIGDLCLGTQRKMPNRGRILRVKLLIRGTSLCVPSGVWDWRHT